MPSRPAHVAPSKDTEALLSLRRAGKRKLEGDARFGTESQFPKIISNKLNRYFNKKNQKNSHVITRLLSVFPVYLHSSNYGLFQ